AFDVVDLPLAGFADEIVMDHRVGGILAGSAMATERSCQGRLVGVLLLRRHRERLDVRLLRVGDGIEIDRPDVAFGAYARRFSPIARSATSTDILLLPPC